GIQWFPISKLAQCSNTSVYRPTEGEKSINFSLVSQYIRYVSLTQMPFKTSSCGTSLNNFLL
ncbi:unnamed protein product, partial [Hymenolepis diminuta]